MRLRTHQLSFEKLNSKNHHPPSGRVGAAGEGTDPQTSALKNVTSLKNAHSPKNVTSLKNAQASRNLLIGPLPTHSCLVPDPPKGRVMSCGGQP